VLADTAHGHVYISQGPDGGANAPIVVTNLSGGLVATIGDGANGLALSANDATLYAAIGDTVVGYSTTTLKETVSYQLPGRGFSLALQGSRLWVSYQSAGGQIGDIDLSTGTANWNVAPGGWLNIPPAIAIDPSGSGVLVTSSEGETPPWVTTYNVSNPAAVTQIATATEMGCANNGLSVLPGGATFFCDGFPYGTKTLLEDSSGTYYGGFNAVAPNGAVAISNGEGIEAYPAGKTAPTAEYDEYWGLPVPTSFDLQSSSPVGFGWSASGNQLFTVMESTSYQGDSIFSLLSLYPFEQVPAPLTLTSTATTIGYDGAFTATAHLGVTDTNRAYSVYETTPGHPKQLIHSCPCDPSGITTISGSSWTTNTTYTAVFTGDAQYLPTTVALTIKVGVKISDSLSGYYKTATVAGLDYHLYHRNATLKNLVTVAPNKTGECVRFEVQQSVKNVWHADGTTGCTALNKWSQAMLTRKLTATGWYRFRADFTASAKDTTNVSTDGPWLYYTVPS
jgi:hypothetical protein